MEVSASTPHTNTHTHVHITQRERERERTFHMHSFAVLYKLLVHEKEEATMLSLGSICSRPVLIQREITKCLMIKQSKACEVSL